VDELARLYRVRFTDAERARKDAIWRVLCERFFQRYVPPDATVLDLACGYGEFMRHIKAGRKIAVDLNPETRSLLPPDVEFHQTDAANLPIDSASVHVCFSSNFFEHLPSKTRLDQVLNESLRVLRPGGLYVCMQPNLRYAPGEYWDYYDHVLPLTHLSCQEAFRKAGFEVIELIDRFIPFSTASRLPQAPWLVRLYLAFRPAWRLLGRQFVLVARKPAPGPGSVRDQGGPSNDSSSKPTRTESP
jgi:ubiquinone/menaquinone biosynthesis C-methylase UbiE